MNDNNRHKIQIIFVLAIVVLLIGYSFINPSITGHVSAAVNKQKTDLVINESKNFQLTTYSEKPFLITSFKISGNVSGSGQVRIYIDTGKGQKLMVYNNVGKKKTYKNSFSKITANVIANSKEKNEDVKESKVLELKPLSILFEREVFSIVNDDEILIPGVFDDECADTCLINMEIAKDISYRLVFLVEKGTILRVNEITFNSFEE